MNKNHPPCPSVLVIILNWNNPHDTIECLESVLSLAYSSLAILVVDNGSTDQSVEALHEWSLQSKRTITRQDLAGIAETKIHFSGREPTLTLLETDQNLGYAGGNNRGLKVALGVGSDYAFVLNNDTVVAPDSITHLVEAAEADPEAAMVTGKLLLYDSPGTIYAAGVDYAWGRGTVCVGRDVQDLGQYDRPRDCDSLSGAALLIKCAALRSVGLFDEAYFLVLEETDLCYRMRRQGYRLLYEPQARILHKSGATAGPASPTMLYYSRRNAGLFSGRYKGRIEQFALRGRSLAGDAVKCTKWIAKRQFAQVRAVCRGYRDSALHRYGCRTSA